MQNFVTVKNSSLGQLFTRSLLVTFIGVVSISYVQADLYKCRKADGSIEYSDSGCGGKITEQRYNYTRPTNPGQSNYGASSYSSGLDGSARKLGFQSYSHYQQARSVCLGLLQDNPIYSTNNDCGTNMQCLQREAEAMQRRFENLANSSSWKSNKCAVIVEIESANRSRSSGSSYEIEVSHNDELFIINGEKYEARTYCFNMNVGDQVIFIDGSPLGACASATVVNLRTKDKCELWCE